MATSCLLRQPFNNFYHLRSYFHRILTNLFPVIVMKSKIRFDDSGNLADILLTLCRTWWPAYSMFL